MNFIVILFAHWIADFVLQNDEMAQGKSKSLIPLSKHIWRYVWSMGFMLIPIFMNYPVKYILSFIAINGISHFIIDYFTSRMSARLWKQKRVHDFFVCIGFDQFLHIAILYTSWVHLLN